MQNKSKKIIVKNNVINYILKNKKRNGPNISVVFLCGYRSDIYGTKANFLLELQSKYGFEFLMFDYSGHGKSTGNIDNCYFENWVYESHYVIKKKTSYPIIVIGSSMGGWIGILISLYMKKKIKAFIGIATAADFTGQMIKDLNIKKKIAYILKRKIYYQSSYNQKPYSFSRKFIKNSEKFFILDKKIDVNFKVALFYGKKDNAVKLETQIKILTLLKSKRAELLIFKNSDHRMSSKEDLVNIEKKLIEFISA